MLAEVQKADGTWTYGELTGLDKTIPLNRKALLDEEAHIRWLDTQLRAARPASRDCQAMLPQWKAGETVCSAGDVPTTL